MYHIKLKEDALKFLKNIPKSDASKILSRINSLAENPRSGNVIKLKGTVPDEYRARQGNYRIRFYIKDDLLVVEVIDIDHRKDAYK